MPIPTEIEWRQQPNHSFATQTPVGEFTLCFEDAATNRIFARERSHGYALYSNAFHARFCGTRLGSAFAAANAFIKGNGGWLTEGGAS